MTAKVTHYRQHISINIGISHRAYELIGLSNLNCYIYFLHLRLCIKVKKALTMLFFSLSQGSEASPMMKLVKCNAVEK
ncbi:MAG: hypothetical protein ACJASB_001877 [Shewanella psychromarinicola]|jgi:hypothetical protein